MLKKYLQYFYSCIATPRMHKWTPSIFIKTDAVCITGFISVIGLPLMEFFIRNSWSDARMNKQDSLVIGYYHPCYFKVFDKKARLEFEGPRGNGTELEGELKYFYRTGQLKRIEFWGGLTKDTLGSIFRIYDAPGHEGTWKYYRKNGTLKKEIVHFVKLQPCESRDALLPGAGRKVYRYKRKND